MVVLCLWTALSCSAQTSNATLETSETLFTVLTAMNACGFDKDLEKSSPLRGEVRAEVKSVLEASSAAHDAAQPMCTFYHDHQGTDAAKDLSQYVSLALYMNPPPAFGFKVKEAELPPDASTVSGLLAYLPKFYETAGVHKIWLGHQQQYAALTQTYHEPLQKLLFDTEVYLKLPSSGYLGRQFTVYLDPMGAPDLINARNYGTDYSVVISPAGDGFKTQQIRHTYLHYLLDPLGLKNGSAFKRLEPLLQTVTAAPMDENFKTNISLLVTECLVRAIETKTTKATEAERQKTVGDSVQEGYILTRYFYDALTSFEKDPAGIRNAYPELVNGIDVGKETKRAAQIQYAQQATPELLHLSSRPTDDHLLLEAEKRLRVGDVEGATRLAQQGLDEGQGDMGRALFILAQTATANRDIAGARTYFERAILVAREPKVVAWSHVYLGRIFDLQENREAAIEHYQEAMKKGGGLPEIKAAAQRGLDEPYEPPAGRREQTEQKK